MNRISHPEYEALAHLFTRSDHDTYEESAYGQAMEAARVAIYRDMQAACADADVSAPCKFLPQVTDYERNRRTKQEGHVRFETLGEVLSYALDSSKRPNSDTAMELLLLAAKGEDIGERAEALVQALCNRVAEANAEVD